MKKVKSGSDISFNFNVKVTDKTTVDEIIREASDIIKVRFAEYKVEPEESEDERIRKKLLECCTSPTFEIQTGIKNEVLKGWLEKQKEQKPNYCHYGGDPNVERCRWCSAACSARLIEEQKSIEWNYDNRVQYDNVKSGIEAFASTYSFNIESKLFPQLTKEQQQLWRDEIEQAVIAGGENGVELTRDNRYKENRTIEWNEDDEQYLLICKNALQKYQQSNQWDANIISDWLEKRLKSSYQPKQEWSEEDEKMLNRVLESYKALDAYIEDNTDISEEDKIYNKKLSREETVWLQNRFKFLCPQPQKLEEWSEEDKDAIQQAILALEDRYDEYEPNLCFLGYKLPFNKAAERLKSLRPQPHWKPSKEQIDAVRYFVNKHQSEAWAATGQWKQFTALRGLLGDLLKQM